MPPGRFGGVSPEARVGDALKILHPPQPSSAGHNILKQIIPSCLVDSPRDISLIIFHPKLERILKTFKDEKEAFPMKLKIYFQHASILSITDCHLQKS